ncbi:MAG: cytochrome c family protein [Hyphomicrobiales bacterium]|nr:cytochrome c family protein [Hyphomicrobiales bacterium]
MKRTIGLAAALLLAGMGSALAQDGDAANGEKVFKKCKACHAIGDGAKNKVGPQLNGIVGRAWGSIEDFKYSDDLKTQAAEGKVWDDATLDAYLAKPKDIIPKGKMAFPGLKKDEDRADVIAYLKTFSAQ